MQEKVNVNSRTFQFLINLASVTNYVASKQHKNILGFSRSIPFHFFGIYSS